MAPLRQQVCGWVNSALAFVYPESCQICARIRATPAECYVCEACRAGIALIDVPFCQRCGLPYEGEITTDFVCSNCAGLDLYFSSARSAALAKGVLLEIIHRYKYQRAFWFEPLLVELLVQKARSALMLAKWDLIVPVPLHSTKQREREFNQAERLARGMSNALNIPLETGLVRRVVPTPTQTLLNREQREANMRRAFGMCSKNELTRQRVILVDDVFTTGATSSACAKVLRGAGASDVCVWTVARGI